MLVWLSLLLVVADPLSADQSVIDRGHLRIGPSLVQQFRLTNRGTQPITITDVKSTCGCLAPKLDQRELPPGASTNLTVEINTLSQPAGPVSWITRIRYRVGDQTNELPLELRASLLAEVRVEPASVAFSIRQTRSVELKVNDSRTKPFRITGVGTSMPQLKAELIPNDKPNENRIRLTASADGPAGVQSAVAWFTTDDPLYPQIKVPVTVTIPRRHRVAASPSMVDLSPGGTFRVLLRDQENQQVIVDRIEIEGPLTATISSGAVTTIAISCLSKCEERDGTVIVHVREPVAERISIPVIIR